MSTLLQGGTLSFSQVTTRLLKVKVWGVTQSSGLFRNLHRRIVLVRHVCGFEVRGPWEFIKRPSVDYTLQSF